MRFLLFPVVVDLQRDTFFAVSKYVACLALWIRLELVYFRRRDVTLGEGLLECS